VEQLAGTKACLWSLGGSNSKPTPKERCNEVEVQYPLACARAILATHTGEEKIRFLFVSGTLSVRNQEMALWLLSVERRSRGLAESKLLEMAKENKEKFETNIIKCGYVVKRDSKVTKVVVGLSGLGIKVDELAGAMIDDAIDVGGGNEVD